MKKLILLLGNGVTIDLFSKIKESNKKEYENIDLVNLFAKGDTVNWPDGSQESGFLSYKYCPHLWNLGARPNMNLESASNLIEDIITCANMTSCTNVAFKDENIYINAYYELVAYLKYLFIQYNNQVKDADLKKIKNWGWLNIIEKAYKSTQYDKIIIVTYNYDIFLERILTLKRINFKIGGLEKNDEKIVILKPHGSISFTHEIKADSSLFSIKKSKDMYEASLEKFKVRYKDLSDNYMINAIIPPAGDSSRLTFKWANDIKNEIIKCMQEIGENDKFIISGLSYWHVDRREIDELLLMVSNKKIDTYMVNPNPPRALMAVLTCVLPKHITYISSNSIGGVINE